MKATIIGTITAPVLEVRHPTAGMRSWIRTRPRARQVGNRIWNLPDPGAGWADDLSKMGVAVGVATTLADAGGSVEKLSRPLILASDHNGRVRVFPRLAGTSRVSEMLPTEAVFDRAGVFICPDKILSDAAADDFDVDPVLLDPAKPWPPKLDRETRRDVRALAEAQNLDDDDTQAAYERVAAVVGDVPDWFGMNLYPYQRTGAMAAAAGRGAVVDPPGMGKTRQALAALAIHGCRRAVIVTPPPPVVIHWQREVTESRLAEFSGPNGQVVAWQSGKKLPPLPETGVLVVPDTLLSSRPELIDAIAAWRPDGFAVDEVHRAKTWEAKRSIAVRRAAKTVKTGIRIATSGTPMLANVHEMASMLSITKKLKPAFGGLAAFEEQFCYQNKFGGWNSRRRALPKLKRTLDSRVWVRRQKIMPTEKHRFVSFVEPDKAIWREANRDVYATIDRFLTRHIAEHGSPPGDSEIMDWSREELGLITQMRRAAGLAKVDAIADKAAEWVEGYTEIDDNTGDVTYLRPLIIWTWHQTVSEALAKAVPSRIGEAGVIIGSTKRSERDRLVDEYQAGNIPVLVCSIPTVGVGVTLTRGHDAWFSETSWTPAEVSQAEDRQFRIGQQHNVQVTTFIAPGTLDERIQDVLARKSEELEEVLTGGDNDVGVLEKSSAAERESLMTELVKERIPAVTGRRRARAAA